MKKRTAFIGAILSLIPFWQPLFIKTGIALVTSKIVIFNSDWAIAETAEFYFKLGNQKLDSEDYNGAISDYTKAIKINPEDGNAYRERGVAKSFLEDYKGALSDYRKAIKINPDDYEAYNIRGSDKLDNLNNYKGALSDFSKAIEINSQYADAYYNRALAKENSKDFKGAIKDYTKAIEFFPKGEDAGDAYHGRGYAKKMLKDFEGAIKDYTKATKLIPEDGVLYMDIHLLKLSLEDIEGAVSARNKSLELYSKDKVDIDVKNIIAPAMLKRTSSPMLKQFNRFARFDGKTYQKPITYYIYDQIGKIRSKTLPKKMQDTYEISDDAEKFIIDIFSKIDSYIDLDFMRVDSPSKAMIKILKTNSWDDYNGMTTENFYSQKYSIEIAWSESEYNYPKLKKYPTLSVDTAHTIVHEIAHALGLQHAGCGQDCKFNIDPDDTRINNKDTVMSYNNLLYEDNNRFLTDLDIKALRQMWGVEKDN